MRTSTLHVLIVSIAVASRAAAKLNRRLGAKTKLTFVLED